MRVVFLLCGVVSISGQYLSDEPSSLPSDLPSIVPSTAPSHLPTLEPSTSSSPTNVKSNSPTDVWSSVPTTTPSTFPSLVPTPQASSEPSMSPSWSPTPECHDVSGFRSPVNGFRCSDHHGTNCMNWRYLGLNSTQVAELVTKCPVSCQMECESANLFRLPYMFQLDGVETFLGSESTAILEGTSVEYLTNQMQMTMSSANIFLETAELVKQQILPGRRMLRSSNTETTSLIIKMDFRGLAIGVATGDIEDALASGVLSTGFSRALQISGDQFLEDAVVGEFHDMDTPVGSTTDKQNGNRRKLPRGTVTAIIAAVLLLAAIVFAVLCTIRNYLKTSNTNLNGDVDGSNINSPAESVRSFLGTTMSFGSEITKVKSNLQQQPSESSEASSTTEIYSKQSHSAGSSSQNVETEEDEHEPVGILPPMIVIDNIDTCDNLAAKKNGARDAEIDPVAVHSTQISDELLREISRHPRNNLSKSLNWACLPSTGRMKVTHPTSRFDSPKSHVSHGSFDIFSSGDEGSPHFSSPERPSPPVEISGRDNDNSPSDLAKDVNTGGGSVRQFLLQKFATKSSSPMMSFRRKRSSNDEVERSTSHPSPKGLGDSDPSLYCGHLPRGSCSDHSNRSPRRSSPNNSDTSAGKSTSSEHLVSERDNADVLEFELSNVGKLGLELECGSRTFPTILHVKDYSPLLGKVFPGDQIIDIGGVITENLALNEVTSLLGNEGRRSIWQTSRPPLRFRVSRPSV